MQHKPLAGQDTVQHNAQYDSTALHGLLNGQAVSYTHLTMPTIYSV